VTPLIIDSNTGEEHDELPETIIPSPGGTLTEPGTATGSSEGTQIPWSYFAITLTLILLLFFFILYYFYYKKKNKSKAKAREMEEEHSVIMNQPD